jgi:DNA-binding response OmpR family regulator
MSRRSFRHHDLHALEMPGSRMMHPRRILVVDDNVDSAVSMAMVLEMHGHEVETAYDGESGFMKAVHFRPHLVLLDIGMPGIDGLEVALRLRTLDGGDSMTLVAVTGWGQEEDRRRTRDAGFDHHFTKPVDPEMLAHFVADLSAHRRDIAPAGRCPSSTSTALTRGLGREGSNPDGEPPD